MFDENAVEPLCLTGVNIDHHGAFGRITMRFGRHLARKGCVSYSVQSQSKFIPTNRRREMRQKVRLQSGKIIDEKERFIVDCMVRDRGETGFQLRLYRNVRLQGHVRIYDDQSRTVVSISVVWRHGIAVGCRTLGPKLPANEKLIRRMESKYYALR